MGHVAKLLLESVATPPAEAGQEDRIVEWHTKEEGGYLDQGGIIPVNLATRLTLTGNLCWNSRKNKSGAKLTKKVSHYKKSIFVT